MATGENGRSFGLRMIAPSTEVGITMPTRANVTLNALKYKSDFVVPIVSLSV